MRKAAIVVGAVITLLLGAVSLAQPAGAGNGGGGFLDVQPLYILAQPTFSFDLEGDGCTEEATVTVVDVAGAVISFDDDDSGTITLPVGSPGGFYEVTLECAGAGAPITASSSLAFGNVIVVKVVEGAAPADASFPIEVSCSEGDLVPMADGDPNIDATLVFGATGGTQYLVHYTGQDCTVSELDDGGAISSSITTEDCGDELQVGAVGPSGEFGIFDAVDCTQTVTNVFPAAVDPVDETPAPAPVVAQPTFTG
jgi:hypothetical protein